jgi:outer membrane protein OmpA-like peptidoglycan-associated protein/opacity protein-like surface antigen
MRLRGSGWLAALAGCAVALGATSGFAQSGTQEKEGLYVTGAAGASFPRDSTMQGAGFDQDAQMDTGWMALIGLGNAYGNGFRTELELGYQRSSVDSVGSASASGHMAAGSLMANVYYDLPVSWPVRPFIGLGLGAARVSADSISPVNGSRVDDSDIGFAWQATAGLAYAINDRLDATVAYRYFDAPVLNFRTDAGTSLDSDYASHIVMVGLRYSFGGPAPKPMPAAAPAPMPAPAPAPAPMAEKPMPPVQNNYLVFFDWDKSTLTQQARDIIRTAADAAKKKSPVRIRATGHTDRSGPDRYNMRLSLRRANAVKAELVRLGIPASDIAVVGKGETEPLVQTADGVREPQNRRVEIIIE